jgi:methylamine dehydrogenase accessory protein MauD
MEIALLIGRLLLALVFLVAGLAKLADRAGSRQGLIDFGVPATLATPLGILLPLAELAVAVALIPTSTAWWGAIGALALLLLFVTGIGVNLARGRKPDCHCFGQLHSAPAGWSTLLRNGVLVAVAGFIVWQGTEGVGPSALSWLGGLSTVSLLAFLGGLLALALVLLAVEGWFLVHLLRQNGRLLVRLEALEQRVASGDAAPPEAEEAPQAQPEVGLPVGTEAPVFSLQGLYGETLTLEAFRARGKPVMLLFTDPNCGPCTSLLPEIGRWQQEHAEKLTVSLISRGAPEENRTKSAEHGLTSVLLQGDWEISEAYQVEGTPSAVIVEPDGKIGSPLAAGPEAIRSQVARTVEEPAQLPVHPQQAQEGEPCPNCGQVHADNGQATAQEAALEIGEAAPPLKLPNLKGKKVNLAAFRGKKTLVLFWNPGCGFCQQMLDDLKDFEANPPEGAPKLLVVSTGTVAENLAMGLLSTVVLDQNFSVGSAFGANGTPMAVLVDEQGKIASELAAGGPAVLALAGVAQDPSSNGSGGGQAAPVAAKIGEPAPLVKLPDLGGSTVDLPDFKGTETLVLFWNPGCGFCQRMLDDLKALESDPPEGAPEILVVSAGTAEDNRAMGLRSRVVLDQGFSVGSAFGASGTPSAVLVDSEGKVASEVAVGAPAVLGLAGASQTEA